MATVPVYHRELDRYSLIEEDSVPALAGGGWEVVRHADDPRIQADIDKAEAEAEATAAADAAGEEERETGTLGTGSSRKKTAAKTTATSGGEE